MIVCYLLAAAAGLTVYACGARFGKAARIGLAFVVFLVPAVSLTLWILVTGDKWQPGAMTVLVTNMAASKDDDIILEFKDVQFFKALETSSLPMTIKLSGLAFHSSLAVKTITTKAYDHSLQVLVHLAPATKGLSGSFEYSVVVPTTVNAVTFGKAAVSIWDRDTGITRY